MTPFFLYMQTARPIIATDLGEEVPKGAVSAEGTRRWKEMPEGDKLLWSNAYKDNLRLYNARIHSYKNGNSNAKDMSDEAALAYAEEHNIDSGPADASAQLLAENHVGADEDAEGEDDIPVPEPTPKTPKTKSKKSKSKDSEPKAPVETVVPLPSAKAATPEKKRKRQSTSKAQPVGVVEKEATIIETPKTETKSRKSRSKKAKTDA